MVVQRGESLRRGHAAPVHLAANHAEPAILDCGAFYHGAVLTVPDCGGNEADAERVGENEGGRRLAGAKLAGATSVRPSHAAAMQAAAGEAPATRR